MAEEERKPAIHPVKFWTEYENNPEKPGEKIAIEWVSWVKIGTMTGETTNAKVDRLKPRKNRAGNEVVSVEWPSIEKAYNAWKAGEETPEEGTPLAAWPGVTTELMEALKPLHILTVEDFAQSPDHVFRGLPVPNLNALRDQAFAFLLAQGGDAQTAAEIQNRDARIAELESSLSDAKENSGDLDGLRAENDQLKSDLDAAQAELATARAELEETKSALSMLTEAEPTEDAKPTPPAKPKKAATNKK